MLPMLLVVLLTVAAVKADESALNKLCSSEYSCFVSNENCTPPHCEMIFSFNNTNSSILVNHLTKFDYVMLYHHLQGVRQDDVVVCWPERCLLAREEKDMYMEIKNLQNSRCDVLDEKEGNYLYRFPRIVSNTGKNITYSYRIGSGEEQVLNPPSHPLIFVATSKPVQSSHVNESGKDVRFVYSDNLDAIDEEEQEQILAKPRVKKEDSKPTVKTVEFEEVWKNRMVFKKTNKLE